MMANVEFVRDGKPSKQVIRSFAAPLVYNKLLEFKNFPVDVNVTLQKNGNYWNWTSIESPEKGNQSVETKSPIPQTGKVVGSNWETSEERARRQVYIVRQSSVSSAIELLKAQSPKGVDATIDKVLEIAKEIEAHVFEVKQLADTPE